MKKKLKNAIGPWVSGERFWNRNTEMEILINRINDGANISLVAQRRIGKTSILRELTERIKDDYTCLFVDLQQSKCSEEAITEISKIIHSHKPLWKKVKEAFANIFGKVTDSVEEIDLGEIGVKIRSGLTKSNWQEKGDQIFSILAKADIPVVLMLDEMPIMLNFMLKGNEFKIAPERKEQADMFLSWFRKNTLKYQGKVRTIISGSIGLEPILRQARLSATINHFEPFELKPWSEDTAVDCIKALSNEYGLILKDNVPQNMTKRLGCCIPHHVQMFFGNINYYCQEKRKKECSLKDVKHVYETMMLNVRGHAELTHYEERLEMVLGKELFTLAIDMLTETAITGYLSNEAIIEFQKEYSISDKNIADAQKEILWVLEHDGYLKQKDNKYTFVSKLLRDWWKTRLGSGFVPVLERGV